MRTDSIGVARDGNDIKLGTLQFRGKDIELLLARGFDRVFGKIKQRVRRETYTLATRRRGGWRRWRWRRWWRGLDNRRGWWRRRRGRCRFCAAKFKHESRRIKIDVTLVADGIVYSVALTLEAHTDEPIEIVLRAEPEFVIGRPFFGRGINHRDRSSSRERVLGVGVVHTGAREKREFLTDGHAAHGIEIHALDLDVAAQAARR